MSALVTRPGTFPVLRPQSFADLVQFADMAAKSQMVPVAFRNKPEDIMLAVQMGSELGMAPMQAIRNISVINGRPAVWGDAMPALCRSSQVCEDIIERFDGDGDKLRAVCIAKRRGAEPVVATFGVEDAKKAGLWNKAGPWQQYPRRMLQMRARGFALRDAFPDVLGGLIAAEEAQDIPPEATPSFSGTTLDHEPRAPIPAPSTASREAINAAVPLDGDPPVAAPVAPPAAPKKATIAEWLANLEAELSAAQTENAVEAIVASGKVQQAMKTFKPAAVERLEELVVAARARVTPPLREPGEDLDDDPDAALEELLPPEASDRSAA